MQVHNQFTTVHFLIASVVLLIINLLVIKLKKQNWKTLKNWKTLIFAFVLVLLGLLYTETSIDKDWKFETYGFPRYILLNKSSIDQNAFVNMGITRFDYINFIQNLIVFYLLMNVFMISFKREKV